jgi:RHS repeat-associated protein
MKRREFNLLAIAALQSLRNRAQAVGTTGPSLAEGASARRVGMMRPNGAYVDYGTEHIDQLSGNLNFSATLVQAISRGLDANFTLSYNSQLWLMDSGKVQGFGLDTGVGFGWRLQVGSVLPIYSAGSSISGYTYVDLAGAEYPMVQSVGASNLWETKQGLNVTLDALASILYFPTGTSWVMGSISAQSEADAGAMYPTLIEDSNGNQITVQYLPGIGRTDANTSSRIASIEDARAVSVGSGRQTYSFVYSADPLPRLLSVVALIPTGENYNFTYSTQPVKSPFGSADSPAFVQALSGFAAVNEPGYIFNYSAEQTGEVGSMTIPTGGLVKWDYAAVSQNGTSARAVSQRQVQASPSSSAMSFVFQRSTGQVGGTPTSRVSMGLQGGTSLGTWDFDGTTGSPTEGLLLSEATVSTSSGAVLRQATYEWTQTSTGNIYEASATNVLDPGTASQAQSRTETTKDSFGNVTQSTAFEFNNLSQPSRIINHTYVTDPTYTSRYLRQLLLSTNVTKNGVATNVRSNVYDSTPLVARGGLYEHNAAAGTSRTVRGNLTESVVSGVYTRRQFDITGALSSTQDGMNSSVTFVPAANTNNAAPGQIVPNGTAQLQTSLAYDTALRPVLKVDANGNAMNLSYDARGRLTSVVQSGQDPITHTYGFNPKTITTTKGSTWTRRTMDGLGRLAKVERGSGTTATHAADFEYDPEHTSKISRSTGWYSVGSAPDSRTLTYDALGRVTQLGLKGNSGVVSFNYAGNTKTRIGASGRTKTLAYNATGALQQVIQPSSNGGSAPERTLYEYDGLNHLTTVTMPRTAGTQRRRFQYDANGRVIQKGSVEAGAVSYTYNLDGTIASKTDALRQSVTYQYDQNKRVTSATRSDSTGRIDPGQTTTYHYDTQPFDGSFSQNALGRLAAVQWGSTTSPAGRFTEMYSYSPSGQRTAKRLTVERSAGTATLDLAYGYDSNGRLASITYPGGTGTFEYSRDSLGRQSGLTAHTGGTSVAVVKDVGYTPKGDVSAMKTLIPGTSEYYSENRSYNARSQVTRISAGPETAQANASMPAVDLRYSYHPSQNDGKVRKVQDAVAGETVHYSYDNRGRIAAAETEGDGWGLSFQYDEFGNLTTQQVTKGSAPTLQALVDPATNRVTHPSIVYDANGNMIQTGATKLQYNIENRLVAAEAPGGVEQYAYHPNGSRIWTKTSDGNEELAVYGLAGRKLATFRLSTESAGLTLTPAGTNLYFNGKLIHSNGAAVVTDPVNSVRARVGAARGQDAAVSSYYPFGQDRASAGENTQAGTQLSTGAAFKSSERSSATMLDYAKKRNYSSTMARFLSPGGKSRRANPESWNQYAFVGNDPVNYHDAYEPDSSNDGGGGGGGGGGTTGGTGGTGWYTTTVSTSYTYSGTSYTGTYSFTFTTPTDASLGAADPVNGLDPDSAVLAAPLVIPSVGEAYAFSLLASASLVLVSVVTKSITDVAVDVYKEWRDNRKQKENEKKKREECKLVNPASQCITNK